jgi:hypothetical protein
MGLNSLRKKSSGRHSERSEESLLIQNKSLREILRAKSPLGMTEFCIFPQPVKTGADCAHSFITAGPSDIQSAIGVHPSSG